MFTTVKRVLVLGTLLSSSLSFARCYYHDKRVRTFNVEHMPWEELKKEHVQQWTQLYLWLDGKSAEEFKELTNFKDLPKEHYSSHFYDETDYKLLPGATTVNPVNARAFEEYKIPIDHTPGWITEKNFKETIPYSYTHDFYSENLYGPSELPKKFIATAALGGFRYMERHLFILRPVLYKDNEQGMRVSKSLNLGNFFSVLTKSFEHTLTEEERANLLVPQSVSFWKVKKMKIRDGQGRVKRIRVTQPHLLFIDRLAPHIALEVNTVTQDLAEEAAEQLTQMDLRMFFYSLTNMAYWVNRHHDERGLHHDVNKRKELNFIEEVFRLLETKHKVVVEGKEWGYVSAHLEVQEDPGFWREMKEYLRHRNPKQRIVRDKAVERNIRAACKYLNLPCQIAPWHLQSKP